MWNFIDKYNRFIGIFLILAILAGGGGIIYKNSKSEFLISKQIPNSKFKIQNEVSSISSQTTGLKPQTSKLNINTASEKELESLPKIGTTKARAIVDYRKKYGKFKDKRGIIKVKGIGEGIYKKIEALIEI